MSRRVSIYVDESALTKIANIAGPFGSSGLVVFTALRDGRDIAEGRPRDIAMRHVSLRLHPATILRIETIAAAEGVSWQEAARRVIDAWVAKYLATSGVVRQAG